MVKVWNVTFVVEGKRFSEKIAFADNITQEKVQEKYELMRDASEVCAVQVA